MSKARVLSQLSFNLASDATVPSTSFTLANSGVTAGTYGSASQVPILVIDAKGRVTSASTTSVAGVSSFGYNTSTGVLTISTADGGSYTAGVTLAPFTTTNLAEGTNQYFTNARARSAVSAIGSLSYNSTTGVFSYTQGNTDTVSEGVTNLYFTNTRARSAVSGSTGISYTSSTGVFTIDSTVATLTGTQTLTNKTLTSPVISSISNVGTITVPTTTGTLITTGDTGTVTNTMLAGSIATSKITGLAASATTDTTNAANITSGTLPNARLVSIPNTALANSSVTVGTTSISLGASSTTLTGLTSVTSTSFVGALTGNASTATTLATARTISLTGDVTYTSGSFDGSANVTGTATLANSGVTAGTYNNTSTAVTPITVDAKGRITSTGTAVTITPAWSSITGTPTTISGYGITDAYTKTQVDAFLQGLDPKASVIAATTANITLSAPQTIDGIALVAGDRVLVKNQTTASQNGIYVVAAAAWTRATDMDVWAELPGTYVFVEKGTTYADTGWVCTVDAGGTIDTTAVTWVQFAGAGTYTGTAPITVSGTAISLATTGTAGTYTKVTTDAYGRVSSGTTLSSADLPTYTGTITSSQVTTALGFTPYNSTNPSGYISGNQTITLSGDVSGSGATSIIATLASVGTAGTYTKVTTDAKGRVTSGTTLSASDIPSLSATYLPLSGGTLSGAINWGTNLPNAKKIIGIYQSGNLWTGIGMSSTTASPQIAGDATVTTLLDIGYYTNDATQAWTSAVQINKTSITVGGNTVWHAGNLTNLNQLTNGPGYLTGTKVDSITATSPIVASASTGAVTLSHANSGVTAGTYNNVTVNALGHVTGGSNVSYLTSYTETDTLATVTGRGASANTSITVNSTTDGILTVNKSSGTTWGYINFNYGGTRKFYFGLNSASEPELGTDNSTVFRVIGGMTIGGNTVYHAGNLTNLNQLSNGPGYITGESDTLATVTARGATTSTASRFDSTLTIGAYNNSNSYVAFNNSGTYWGLIGNYSSNDWRLGYGSQGSLVGWGVRWDASGNAWSNASHRAPIFYDSDDTTYYADLNASTSINAAGTIKATAGRIALRDDSIENWATASDSAGIAVNYYGYSSGTTYSRNFSVYDGKGSARLNVYGASNYTQATGSLRAPLFYDADDTNYYLDPNGYSRLNRLVVHQARVDSSRYPLGHYSSGETVFAIDPTWTNDQLQAFFNSGNVSWVADSSAPGGYAISITGNQNVAGGVYGSGFPYIPVEQDDMFYMECWIKDVSGTNSHYMGSIDYNENFSSLGGNPGSFGYWVMSSSGPGTSWQKYSGYIGGFGASIGQFKSGTKYWSPQALFNYTGQGTSYISGWKVTKVNQRGKKIIQATGFSGGLSTSYQLQIQNSTGTSTAPDITFGADGSYGYIQTWNSKPLLINNQGNYTQFGDSARAPIFYDSNDTGYYVNPNSVSVFSDIRINDGNTQLRTSNVGRNTKWRGLDGSSDVGISFYDANDRWAAQFYANYNDAYGFLNGNWGSWDLRKIPNGNLQMNNNTSYYLNAPSDNFLYRVYGAADIRSPIFYDYNDTGYYCDPNGTSELSGFSNGTKARAGMNIHHYNRQAATSDTNYWVGSQGWGSNYTWNSALTLLGSCFMDHWGNGQTGHPQNTGSNYIHAQGLQVLHYRDGGGGDSNVSYGWQMVGAGDAGNRWWLRGKWGTSIRSWYEIVTYGINVGGSLYPSISYDSDNTGYYVDANSTSRMNLINADYLRSYNYMYLDNDYGCTLMGTYSSYRYQGVWSMGSSWLLPINGTTTGNLYGMCWSHPNAGGTAGNLDSHGLLILINGGLGTALSYSIRANGNITAISDERMKTNWRDMPEDFITKLARVKVGIYDRMDGENLTQVGVSAQSLQTVLPQAVTIASDEMKTLAVSYGNAALASAVELAKEVVVLKEKISCQEERIAKLEELVNNLLMR